MKSLIHHDSAEVLNYNEIDNIVAIRDRAVDLYTQGLKLIAESVSLAKEAVSKTGVTLYYPDEAINSDIFNIDSLTGTDKEYRKQEGLGAHFFNFDKNLDTRLWNLTVEKSELHQFASDEQIKRLQATLGGIDKAIPLFNSENVKSFFIEEECNRETLLIDNFKSVVKGLSWHSESDRPCLFEKKLVIEDAIHLTSTSGRTATFLKRSEINQLHSIFSLLDGKRVPDTQKRLGNEINYKVSRDIRTFETEYFLVRWFKKGSMQLTFTRTDLIRQLNNLITVTFPAFFSKKANDATLSDRGLY
nr:conserved hypothetical protein [Arsenophonus nasoniae]